MKFVTYKDVGAIKDYYVDEKYPQILEFLMRHFKGYEVELKGIHLCEKGFEVACITRLYQQDIPYEVWDENYSYEDRLKLYPMRIVKEKYHYFYLTC